MTTFRRRGHWRTSKYGEPYWVDEHTVERYDWDRSSYEWATHARARLHELEATGSFTARYVNPNATCPVCGEPVFFYQSEYGSRVFFDELGPPWPKHPCTDNNSYLKRRFSKAKKPKRPYAREPSSIYEIAGLIADSELDPSDDFSIKYGSAPWPAWIVRRKFKADDGAILVASPIDSSKTNLLYLMVEKTPRNISNGDTIFYRRGCVEFLSPKSLKPIQLSVEKLSGATELVQKLIE